MEVHVCNQLSLLSSKSSRYVYFYQQRLENCLLFIFKDLLVCQLTLLLYHSCCFSPHTITIHTKLKCLFSWNDQLKKMDCQKFADTYSTSNLAPQIHDLFSLSQLPTIADHQLSKGGSYGKCNAYIFILFIMSYALMCSTILVAAASKVYNFTCWIRC